MRWAWRTRAALRPASSPSFLAKLCDGPLTFRNLDVLREEDL